MRMSTCMMVTLVSLIFSQHVQAQTQPPGGFNGLDTHLGNLYRMSNAQTRSICPENFTGEKGKAGMSTDGPALHAARDLGQGWKVSPYVRVPAKTTFTLGKINGSGAIQQIYDSSPHREDAAFHPAVLLGRRERTVDRGTDG
ncbi:MAG: hypothetical protein ACYC3X_31745 [Pirellulaceae bacterium]